MNSVNRSFSLINNGYIDRSRLWVLEIRTILEKILPVLCFSTNSWNVKYSLNRFIIPTHISAAGNYLGKSEFIKIIFSCSRKITSFKILSWGKKQLIPFPWYFLLWVNTAVETYTHCKTYPLPLPCPCFSERFLKSACFFF